MRYILVCLGFLVLVSCGSAPQRKFNKNIGKFLDSAAWQNQFTGVFIYDPAQKDTLYRHDSDKYFTPASNTKIFTLFAAMELLPELLPQLQYQIDGDTMYFRGTGDPTLLHPYFKSNKSLELLGAVSKVRWVYDQMDANAMGPGWSWGDYDAYYAPERSELPLYGNVVMAGTPAANTRWISPEGFEHQWEQELPKFARDQYNNHFYLYTRNNEDTLEIPYITDTAATRMLLETYLDKKVDLVKKAPGETWETIYGVPADSVYKRMMKNSDNFLAEQLLIQASGMISDTLDPEKAIRFILEGPLAHLKQHPRWVDGSGLSRYNLFTPESMVATLTQLYECYGTERLFAFFPEGGVSGTLKGYFPDKDDSPYIHAKTGTLSNNYNLSGYLVTHSGKLLVFSFMNNHYRESSTTVKQRMAPILEWIRDHY